MGKSENITQKEVIDYINKSHYKYDFKEIENFTIYRVNSIGIRGRYSTLPDGFPDLCGDLKIYRIKTSTPIYLEIKNPDKECTNKDQLKFLLDAKNRGCAAFWCNTLQDFKEKLRDAIIDIVY